MIKRVLFLLLVLAFAVSCDSEKIPDEDSSENEVPEEIENARQEIQIHLLEDPSDFIIPLKTVGVLSASQTINIQAKSSGTIRQLLVQEGSSIKESQPIAKLEDDPLQFKLQQLQNELEEATLKKNELLIQYGGEAEIDTSVPALFLKSIHIKSGYNTTLQSIKQAQYEIDQASIAAPFSGVISDVQVKQYQQVNAGEVICTLINPYSFEAEFLLMESEILKIKIGQSVEISPIALPEMKIQSAIVRINPLVNEQGLVKVYAKLKGKAQLRLFEGMNVQVLVENKIPDQMVVPKEALVLRSGREVIFIYDENEKRAKWSYVKVAYENNTHLAISEGVKPGDKIIIAGNNNLAHDAQVVLKPK